jgi:hypothetical protein
MQSFSVFLFCLVSLCASILPTSSYAQEKTTDVLSKISELQQQGNFQASANTCRQLLPKLSAAPDTAAQVWLSLGVNYFYLTKLDSATYSIEQLQAVLKAHEIKALDIESTALNLLGAIATRQAKYDKALSYYERGIKERMTALGKEDKGIADFYNNMAAAYSAKINFPEALAYYAKSVDIYLKTLGENHPSVATSYQNMGAIHEKLGQFHKASFFFKKSLLLFEQVFERKPHPRIAQVKNNLGVVNLLGLKQFGEALTYFEESLQAYRAFFPPTHLNVGDVYHNIGQAHTFLGNFEAALTYLDSSLISRKNTPLLYAQTLESQGRVYVKWEKKEEGFKLLHRALATKRKENLAGEVALTQEVLAESHGEFNQYDSALLNYQNALSFYTASTPKTNAMNSPYKAMKAQWRIAQLYFKANQPAKLFPAYRKAARLEETLLQQASAEADKLQLVYETHDLHTEAALLHFLRAKKRLFQ